MARKSPKKPKGSGKLAEQGPNMHGTATFSGTGNLGVGGYKQLATMHLNPATQDMADQEQNELEKNLQRQDWSVAGKSYMGNAKPVDPPIPHWDGRNGTRETAVEEQLNPIYPAATRQRDLPGFPQVNALVNPKAHVPANDSPKNEDPVTGKKIQYLGPTVNGVELNDLPPERKQELEAELLETIENARSMRPDRQGWNNTRINSLARRRNHINPDRPPPDMWRPLFRDPTGEHNPENLRDETENMNSPAKNSLFARNSSTPAHSVGAIGFPKVFVPEDYEQVQPEYDDIVKDPIGSRRLQIPQDNAQPMAKESLETFDSGCECKKASCSGCHGKGRRDSVKPVYGSKVPDGMGGAIAFDKSRQKALRNIIELLVREELEGIGNYAYHVTLRKFLRSILENGLLPQEHESLDEPGIFFEPDEEGAAIYHEPPKTVMLRWKLSGTPTSSTPDGEYAHYSPVPSEQLEIRSKKGWVPLRKLIQEQNTVAPRRRGGAGAAQQAAQATDPGLTLPQLRQLLASKAPEAFSRQEVSSVIDYVHRRPDLKQDFQHMDEKEIQSLETVLDNNIDNEKIGPFASKIEMARGSKHLAQLGNQPQAAGAPQGRTPPKRVTTSPGSGPAQKITLPKQALSKQFTDTVQQKYNQITSAAGLSKDQKERLVSQLGRIQLEPDSSEASKLKRIDDLVRVGVGTRVDFGGDQPQGKKPNPAQQVATTPPKSSGGGFIGSAKKFLGLNETLEYLLDEEDEDEKEES